MELPILGKLKDGVKFEFCTLADNVEQTDEFWNWWWNEKAKPEELCRPETIADDDPILAETINKFAANLCSHRQFFDKHLFQMTEKGVFPIIDGLTRDSFRKVAMNIAANASVKLPGRPQIVFAGGGYGSGKTFLLNHLSTQNFLPLGIANLVGVDVFKPLIPEYNLIKAVADGRASLTVQKECQALASQLFKRLIEAGRSFVWDSSMSNKDETLKKINLAKNNQYELTMIAVLTPLKVAIRQGMKRALLSRRFPHPEALPKSHIGFRESFNDYVEHFDEIFVFANMGDGGDTEVIAQKTSDEISLAVIKPDVFNTLLMPAA
ncbi:MAG: zeta toxin family protein [Verrucomicrobiota bacterium]|jgi:predicted kinase